MLITLDVTNMYTNIDHNLAKEAIDFWLSTHPECLPRNIPKEFVLETLSIVLEFNTFTYNGRFYLQIRGLLMGTKSAPTLATLVMAYLEIKLYDIIGERYGRQIQEEFTRNWHRFLDDCFLNWNTEIDTPNNIINILNNLHPSIKFEEYIDHTEVDYLDVTIRKKNGKIITNLFQKVTDSHQYVPFNSCHPSLTTRNIPFNLARRICTIVNEKTNIEKHMKELKKTLLTQGYPPKLIETSFNDAKSIPKHRLRQQKPTTPAIEKLLTFMSTCNPRNPDIFKIIKETLPLLNARQKMKRALQSFKLINSRCQPPNLKGILTRARFIFPAEIERDNATKTKRCNITQCGTCNLLTETSEVLFNNSSTPFQIKENMDCTCTGYYL